MYRNEDSMEYIYIYVEDDQQHVQAIYSFISPLYYHHFELGPEMSK